MKKTIKILAILLFSPTSIFGQDISSTDSLKVVKTFETLFVAIETDDMDTLTNISTDRIYCIICSDYPDLTDSPYIFDKKAFLKNHLEKIKNSEPYQRATKSDKLILVRGNDHRTDITAFWTIYKQDELAPGHEGVQFGVHFKKVNGEFKFAGMETIP
ncbi:hypothetical protein [Ostreibacterium oceani]|uniref:Nuclear transport factor 2 family protein n=1 Tax=Ostreibacterium oceani TaxID=2654998 RepID=A0A6N7F4B1_9GAMM|nr:hypothetical protein [Ostreibacterium oceani]MPV86726.1 hypothetical protein [Ostreibacterium oceani]